MKIQYGINDSYHSAITELSLLIKKKANIETINKIRFSKEEIYTAVLNGTGWDEDSQKKTLNDFSAQLRGSFFYKKDDYYLLLPFSSLLVLDSNELNKDIFHFGYFRQFLAYEAFLTSFYNIISLKGYKFRCKLENIKKQLSVGISRYLSDNNEKLSTNSIRSTITDSLLVLNETSKLKRRDNRIMFNANPISPTFLIFLIYYVRKKFNKSLQQYDDIVGDFKIRNLWLTSSTEIEKSLNSANDKGYCVIDHLTNRSINIIDEWTVALEILRGKSIEF